MDGRILPLAAALLCSTTLLYAGPNRGDDSGVTLLKHPYPYRASLSILSDLHDTTVERFEAVHALVNTSEVVAPGSTAWKALGWDRGSGPSGPVTGFALPFSDTFFPFGVNFGMFRGYDAEHHVLLMHQPDLSDKFVEWHRKGYIDAIHTFGVGDLTREQMQAATVWMRAHLTRPITVSVNHSKTRTPVGVGGPCCTLLKQTLVALRYTAFSVVGQARRLKSPKDLPANEERLGYALLGASVLGGAGLLSVLLIPSRRSGLSVAVLTVLMAAPLAALQMTPVEYHLGDNPDSRFYNLDLLRQLGVRFFWLGDTDYKRSTFSTVEMPEHPSHDGRTTIFTVERFDDGSRGLTFPRNSIDGNASAMHLLDDSSLEHLISVSGHSILYLHWLTSPETYFTARGLSRLAHLKAASMAGRVWVASASTLLQQAYAYAYVVYGAQRAGDEVTIRIAGFDDPIEGRVAAVPADVANLSFLCRRAAHVSVWVGARLLDPSQVVVARTGEDTVVTILPHDSPVSGCCTTSSDTH